jgi:hypothetical protein
MAELLCDLAADANFNQSELDQFSEQLMRFRGELIFIECDIANVPEVRG